MAVGEAHPTAAQPSYSLDDGELVDLRGMSIEERHIMALPADMRRFMAERVLAGYRFQYSCEAARDVWRVWDPQGNKVLGPWTHYGAGLFSGLMFAIEAINYEQTEEIT